MTMLKLCVYTVYNFSQSVRFFVILSLIFVIIFALSNISFCVTYKYFVSGSDISGSDNKSPQGQGNFLNHSV